MNKKLLTVSLNRALDIPGLSTLRLITAFGYPIKDKDPMVIQAKHDMRRYFRPGYSYAPNIIPIRNDGNEAMTKEWLPRSITTEDEAMDWFERRRYEFFDRYFDGPQWVTVDVKVFNVCGRFVLYHTRQLIEP